MHKIKFGTQYINICNSNKLQNSKTEKMYKHQVFGHQVKTTSLHFLNTSLKVGLLLTLGARRTLMAVNRMLFVFYRILRSVT